MKATSYEISKILKKIGFKVQTDFWWIENSLSEPTHKLRYWNQELAGNNIPAYDLETILQFIYSFRIQLYFEITELGYLEKDNSVKSWIITNKNESLTDAAARLLILLHEKGLV